MVEVSGLSASEIAAMGIVLLYNTKLSELKKIRELRDGLHAPKNTKNVQ